MAQFNDYRLGDAVKRRPGAPGCRTFPGSIACMYTRATALVSDMTALLHIVRQRQQSDMPDEKSVVIHMRIGDGIQGPDCWHEASDCFHNLEPGTGRLLYALPGAYYAELLPMLPKAKDGYGIVLVAATAHNNRGGHAQDPTGQIVLKETLWSHKYLREAVNFFEDKGYTVRLREAFDPDVDFTFMAMAHKFVQGGGGFSGLIAQLVAHSGRTVFRSPLLDICGPNAQLCSS